LLELVDEVTKHLPQRNIVLAYRDEEKKSFITLTVGALLEGTFGGVA